ncbi:MAG TPA: thiamine pyrophosphate-dependent enzyme, partial [Chloroflexota bacterium]|nr:thiamine pyrophosphate-dependent enzyme [Chloroflexota bacterium]
ADLIVAVDVKDLYGPLVELDRLTRTTKFMIPAGCKIAEIGYRDVSISKWSDEWQQLVEVDMQIIADSSVTLPLLADLVAQKADGQRVHARTEEIGVAHREARKRWQAEARQDWDSSPISTGRLASEIWEAIKGEDWVLTANTLEEWALKLWDFDQPYRHPGKSLGTSTQIGISLGVALAHKGTSRLVVDIQPDGDLMFDAGALWIAANQQIPMLAVMYNNRAYYNDWEHQIRLAHHRGTSVERASIGQAISDPAPDFSTIARGFGWHAEGPIERPDEIAPALRRAIEAVKSGKPALVDTITQFR